MIKQVTLNNGMHMDAVGIGVYLIPSKQIRETLTDAFDAKYRLIDTANVYFNEVAVGQTIKQSGLKREDIFLTSKIWPSDFSAKRVEKAIDDTLERLGVDYLDLLLLHRPHGDYVTAWQAMSAYVKAGKIKAIGLSNFNIKETKKILACSDIKPVLNQVECHPYYQQSALKSFLDKHDIKLQAWYPIGHGNKKLFNESIFRRLSEAYGKSIVQVILKWHLQNGHMIIPKSTNPEHIKDNINLFDFDLTDEEMKEIRLLDQNKSLFNRPKWITSIMVKLVKPNFSKQH